MLWQFGCTGMRWCSGEDGLFRWSGPRGGGTYGDLFSFSLVGIKEGWIKCQQTDLGLNQNTGLFTDLSDDCPFSPYKKKIQRSFRKSLIKSECSSPLILRVFRMELLVTFLS